jgi:hypothetical protein
MQNLDDSSGAVSFQLGVQSHIMAKKKKDCFKNHHKPKENFSAFSERQISKILNTWSKWYSIVDFVYSSSVATVMLIFES